jgi:hypothetical protein
MLFLSLVNFATITNLTVSENIGGLTFTVFQTMFENFTLCKLTILCWLKSCGPPSLYINAQKL